MSPYLPQFQNPVRATPPLIWTYPKEGSPSCYRFHHRSCMETWVNMHWCSAHRLHPWNRKSESVRTLPIPFCTKDKKSYFEMERISLRCGNVSYKWLCTCFLSKNSFTFYQCTVVNEKYSSTGLRYRMRECRCPAMVIGFKDIKFVTKRLCKEMREVYVIYKKLFSY